MMKTLFVAMGFMAVSIGIASPVEAQFDAASTPESSAGHAIADLIRSQGMYNHMTSAAMVNIEDARGKFIDNQRLWTEVYMTRKRLLEAEHAQALEAARARNLRYREDQASQPHLPPRLYSSQLNSSTGEIAWPPALRRDAFAVQRAEIESLLATRAQMGSSSEISSALYIKVREMQEELRNHIREVVTQEYLDARRFLDSLSLEGRMPIDNQASVQ
jgi:hypothetical protein